MATTTKAGIKAFAAIDGETVHSSAASTPAIAASAQPRPNTAVNTRGRLMPSSSTISGSRLPANLVFHPHLVPLLQEVREVAGLPATTLVAVGLPLMRRIHDLYSGILLNVVEGMSGHIAQMMRLGQLDLAILFTNDVSSKLSATPLLDEELFVLLQQHSTLIDQDTESLTVAEVAKLPLMLPTSTHGLRRRVVAEFERRDLTPHVVAEIDSLTLLMSCVYDGMGVTIKPMSAVQHEGERGKKWRALSISDARISESAPDVETSAVIVRTP